MQLQTKELREGHRICVDGADRIRKEGQRAAAGGVLSFGGFLFRVASAVEALRDVLATAAAPDAPAPSEVVQQRAVTALKWLDRMCHWFAPMQLHFEEVIALSERLSETPGRVEWKPDGGADTSMQRLVEACVRYGVELLCRHRETPFVSHRPASFGVLERKPLNVGTLVALWRYGGEMRGDCPECGGEGFGFAIGGVMEALRFGVCIDCGARLRARSDRAGFFASLEPVLADSLATIDRSVTHPAGGTHEEIRAVLVQLGAQLLPPPGYSSWVDATPTPHRSAGAARIEDWVRATRTPLPSGDRTESRILSADETTEAYDYVRRYANRHERLPELEHLGALGTPLLFPMSSETPRLLAKDAALLRTSLPEQRLPGLVDRWCKREDIQPELGDILRWLEGDEAAYPGAVTTFGGPSVSPARLKQVFESIDPQALRSSLGLKPAAVIRISHRVQYVQETLLPVLMSVPPEDVLLRVHGLRGRRGGGLWLTSLWTKGAPPQWFGPAPSSLMMFSAIRKGGWLCEATDLARMDRRVLRGILAGTPPRHLKDLAIGWRSEPLEQ